MSSGAEAQGLFWATYRTARRIVIAVVGSTILLIGLVLLVTPGPALLVIPIGLAILAIEFSWARRWLDKVRDGSGRVMSMINGRNRERPKDDDPHGSTDRA